MGLTLAISTLLLLCAMIVCGVLSSIAANYSHKKDWSKCRLYSSLSAGISIVVALVGLFLVIWQKTRPVVNVTGTLTNWAMPGMVISFVMLIFLCILVAAFNIYAATKANENDDGSQKYNAAAASAAFGASIVSMICILLLP